MAIDELYLQDEGSAPTDAPAEGGAPEGETPEGEVPAEEAPAEEVEESEKPAE